MSMTFIVVFVLASVAGTALLGFALAQGGKTKKAQQALAERNGWTFDFRRSTGGSGSKTVIHDPKEGWTLTLYSQTSNSGSRGARWSMFEAPGADIPQGMAVLGPEVPAKAAAMADKVLGMLGGDIGVMLLNKMTGGLGEDAQGLRSVDSPGPGHLMATPGAETALDDLRFAPELNNARVGHKDMQQPLVMRGRFGLRVRVARLLRKPGEIEEFIDLGRALADNLKP